VENFAKDFLARAKFERDIFPLSSSEYVTATRVVHKIALPERTAGTRRPARVSACQQNCEAETPVATKNCASRRLACEQRAEQQCVAPKRKHGSIVGTRIFFDAVRREFSASRQLVGNHPSLALQRGWNKFARCA